MNRPAILNFLDFVYDNHRLFLHAAHWHVQVRLEVLVLFPVLLQLNVCNCHSIIVHRENIDYMHLTEHTA